MPAPDDTPRPPGRPRRQVLRWAGVAVGAGALSTVAGCRLRLEQDAVTAPPPPTPDDLARDRAVADAERLLGLLDDVRRLRADAEALLGRVATQLQQHLAALRLPQATTTPTPKPTMTKPAVTKPAVTKPAVTTPSATGPLLTRSTALAALANAEAVAATRTRQDLAGISGDLARLLAGIAASQDCHAAALTAAGPRSSSGPGSS